MSGDHAVMTPTSSIGQDAVFATRASFNQRVQPAGKATGVLLCSPEGDLVAPLPSDDHAQALLITRRAFEATGIGGRDRVLLAVSNDGDGPGPLMLQALGSLAEAAASVGPRGRMRILNAIRALRPTTLVMTPGGAADLLARLHLEFLVDPQELGLERLVVLGEIVPAPTYHHLAFEYDVELHELWCDPIFGVAVAHRQPIGSGGFTPVEPDAVALAALDHDDFVTPGTGGWSEWVVRPVWSSSISAALRSGWVAKNDDGPLPVPTHTVGEHLLVRGRWLSLGSVERAFKRIDGVVGWWLEVERTGTLDRVTMHVVLGRETLVNNPMWAGRIRETLRSLTPIDIETQVHGVEDDVASDRFVDRRGHHLGEVRSEIKPLS
jgi:phenylacetate-CoA ligase